MLQDIAEFILHVVVSIVVFPIVMILATPLILISALLARKPYWTEVRRRYGSIAKWWGEWGWMTVPP